MFSKRFVLLILVGSLLVPAASALTLTKISNPATLPPNTGTGSAFSPDGKLFAVADQTTSPFISIYSISGTTFTKLANPANLPNTSGKDVAFNPSGTIMAVSFDAAPWLILYSITGTTFTKLSDPAITPTGFMPSGGLDFSDDGTMLAVAETTSPFITIYSISGTTFTKLADPATLPASAAVSADFNNAGTFLSVGVQSSPYVVIYSISGTTFTKLADPSVLPPGIGYSTGFSPSGSFLAVGGDTSPFITIYSISGTTFTKLANPATLPSASVRGLQFSPDGSFLAIAESNAPYVAVYTISGSTFTKIADPSTTPTGSGNSLSLSGNAQLMAVGHNTSPFVSIYTTGADPFVPGLTPTAPAGLSATVTRANDGDTVTALIEVRWKLSSNDPSQITGDFSYEIWMDGFYQADDVVTALDGDGQRYNVLDLFYLHIPETHVFWIVAKNGYLRSPNSCSVTIPDSRLATVSCGSRVAGPIATVTIAPSDAAQGLSGFCSSLMGASEGSLFLCGLIMVAAVFLGLAGGFAAFAAGGTPALMAGGIGAILMSIFCMVAGIWPVWTIAVFIVLVTGIVAMVIRRLFGQGGHVGE